MDASIIIMWVGFTLAAYSVVGNDVIQTLGTFLTSNEKTQPWYVLWIFAASILSIVLVNGWLDHDIAYGRLDKIIPEVQKELTWYYVLPPLVLMGVTRMGIPVSTTFMILTLFSLSKIDGTPTELLQGIVDPSATLGKMVMKSILGYIVAFIAALLLYMIIARPVKRFFLDNPINHKTQLTWTGLQWVSTGFLWYNWLTQDLANIYVYLIGPTGGRLDSTSFIISLMIILGLLAYIFWSRGGSIQNIVRSKTNTSDIRSATIVDFSYGIVLYIFKELSNIPMSTTWVFIGLLTGRELAIQYQLHRKVSKNTWRMIGLDLFKVCVGLVVSVILVILIKLFGNII